MLCFLMQRYGKGTNTMFAQVYNFVKTELAQLIMKMVNIGIHIIYSTFDLGTSHLHNYTCQTQNHS